MTLQVTPMIKLQTHLENHIKDVLQKLDITSEKLFQWFGDN